jgi:hypothetical protein
MHPSAVLLRTVRTAAICRDLDRLVVAAGDLGIPADVGPLRRWWTQVAQIIRHDLDHMSPGDPAEHHRLHWSLDRVAIVLATLDGQPPQGAGYPDIELARAAVDLRSQVRRHLGDGMRSAGLPLLLGTTHGELAFEVPWLLDGLDDDRAASVLAALPSTSRIGHRMVHVTRYRWLTSPVRVPVDHTRRLRPSPAMV